jgi:hypothetical protein
MLALFAVGISNTAQAGLLDQQVALTGDTDQSSSMQSSFDISITPSKCGFSDLLPCQALL